MGEGGGKRIGCEVCEECGLVSTRIGKMRRAGNHWKLQFRQAMFLNVKGRDCGGLVSTRWDGGLGKIS